jgi:high-affinity iron transporter
VISSFIIVFRETLEAALIVSIVLAASRGISGRITLVLGGVGLGIVGASLVALSADGLASLFSGAGTEVFNAAVLLLAAVMLGWHQVWMGSHGAELAGQSRAVGAEVRAGSRPLSALALVAAIAVLREGSETVLFLYGIAAGGDGDTGAMLLGSALGIAAATVLGAIIYAGLLRVPLRHVFNVTGAILVLLAAGLVAQAAAYLVQASFLPALGYDIWDTSAILPQQSLPGTILHVLVGYSDQPLGIQILAYLATIAVIILASMAVKRRDSRPA